MCGIAGIHEYAGRGRVDPATLQSMLDAIAHRGPDDEGQHVDGAVGIGNRRLSIIDLAGGHQPVSNEDGTVTAVFNGEIYNYRELRADLVRRGHVFRSEGDTEVLVHLYEDHGAELVHHLRGMFTFAIWDARQERLLIARDRLGIKPLYYADTGERLLFGSEIKSIMRHPGMAAACDPEAVAAFLLLKYVPAPATMFGGVSALPPGCLLTCDRDGVATRAWWDLSFAARAPAPTRAEARAELLELLRDAVRSHLVSDVPYGAFLSGGIDSSLVVALMSQELGVPFDTYCVGFTGAGAELSETPYARLVAERYGTRHHEVLVGAADFIELAPKVIWHLDQPIADDACLANYIVSMRAAEDVKMVLTGEGGDELFAGYARYAGEQLAPLFGLLPDALRGPLARVAATGDLTRPKLALQALLRRDEADRLAAWFPLLHEDLRLALAGPGLREAVRPPRELIAEQLARADGTTTLQRMLYVDTKLWLPDDLLARGDKMSMAASLEARVPLLDHAVVEFAASLPDAMKVRGRHRKRLLREVAADLLPEAVISRPKKGFPNPMGDWLRGDAREFARDLLAPDVVRRRGLLDDRAVATLLAEHDAGFDRGSVLWGLIGLELWHLAFVDPGGRS